MPKPKIILDKHAIDELRSHVALKAGFVVSCKSDCIKLADIINKSDFGPVSASTLYRLFFQASEHVPFKNTLDLLCQFIGYKSASAFQEYILPRREFLIRSGIYVNDPSKSLLFYCIDSNCRTPLMKYFEDLQNTSHATKWSVAISLFDDLQHTSKQKLFFKHFSEDLFVRKFLLENLHDPKFRLTEFETAYLYYLKATPKEDSLNSMKDMLFGKIILFRYYYLQKRFNDANRLGKQIYNGCFDLDQIQHSIHPYLWARYSAYRIWYMHIQHQPKEEIDSYTSDLILRAKEFSKQISSVETESIIHTLSETIYYAGLSLKVQSLLKKTFANNLDLYGMNLSKKPIKTYLKYFERNGLMFMRP